MLTKAIFIVTLLAAWSSTAWGQQCPDWSPKFDQLDDIAALRQLQSQRSQGWPNLNPANNGGVSLQRSIAQGEQLIQQLQQGIQQDMQIWTQIGPSNSPMPTMTAAQCQSRNGGAAMAAACAAHISRNMLLGVEGMNDLMRCRAGLAPDSYAATGSGLVGSEASSYPTSIGDPSFRSGAASVAGLNVSKRTGMVNSVTQNWQPPAQQQDAQDSLAQNTTLADPFADRELKGGGADSSGRANASGSAATSDEANTDSSASTANTATANQWSDPLAADSGKDNREPSPTETSPAPPSQAEIANTLDIGTASSAETSATPVALVTNASNWDQFVSAPASSLSAATVDSPGTTLDATPAPDATDQRIDRDAFVVGLDNAALNRSAVSQKVTGELIGVIGSVAHQENRLLNDVDSINLSDTGDEGYYSSQERLNSDLNELRPAFAKGLPGYKDADALDKELTKLTQNVENRINSGVQAIKDFLNGKPKCDPFDTNPECPQ